jgi:predicted secreted protein
MKYLISGVTVTNWSKEPFLDLSTTERELLRLAIRYSREIVEDSCEALTELSRQRIVKGIDRQMARDFYGSQSAAKEGLAKYFGLDVDGPNGMDTLNIIINKFRQIKAGIEGPFDIVVGGIHDMDDIKQGVSDATRSFFHGRIKEAFRDLNFIKKGTEGWVNSSPTHALNRIHLNKDTIKNYSAGKVARVIVHEASHKFANTDDVQLQTVNGDYSGYKWEGSQGLKYNRLGYQNLENNADSYAWGGRLIWKRKRNKSGGV